MAHSQTNDFLSSSSSLSPSPPAILTAGLAGILAGALLSIGTIFNTIPIAINSKPDPCCSVNGFVNIKYDSNNVTPFLAVVIYTQRNVILDHWVN